MPRSAWFIATLPFVVTACVTTSYSTRTWAEPREGRVEQVRETTVERVGDPGAGAAAGACSGSSGPGGSAMLVRSSSRGDSFWTATFSSLMGGISVDLGDFNADEDRLFVSAFDALDALLETVTLDIDASDRTMHTLSLTATNVAKITFGITGDLGTGSGIYADNLTFSSAMSPVPLPAGGLLILTGLGGLALMRRRRS